MDRRTLPLLIFLTTVILLGTSLAQTDRSPPEQRPGGPRADEPIEVGDLVVADGYRVEPLLDDLPDFPVAIEWDDEDRVYIATAGFAYGHPGFEAPLVLRVEDDGSFTTIADGFHPPLIDITFHEGHLFVSDRGNITRLDVETGEKEVVLRDLPAWGDHHVNEITFGPDGRMYFPIGIATNALVVGIENSLPGFGWTRNITEFADIPCEDVTLAGVNHVTSNPFLVPEVPIDMSAEIVGFGNESEIPEDAHGTDGENVTTGAYVPFGTPTHRGQVIEGEDICTSAVIVVEPDGSDARWYAWGLRNPYGVLFDVDGRLWVSENGADQRGSRPVHASPDRFWQVEEGEWYGYSDFHGGVPTDDPRFALPGEDPLPRLLLENPGNRTGPPPAPAMNFSIHAAVTKFDLSPGGDWGANSTVYLAQYGDHTPATGPPGETSGQGIVRFDLDDLDPRNTETILQGAEEADRRFRPVEAAFGPDDGLYVVNIGAVDIEELEFGPDASPRLGFGAVYVLRPEDPGVIPGPSLIFLVPALAFIFLMLRRAK